MKYAMKDLVFIILPDVTGVYLVPTIRMNHFVYYELPFLKLKWQDFNQTNV